MKRHPGVVQASLPDAHPTHTASCHNPCPAWRQQQEPAYMLVAEAVLLETARGRI